MRAIGTDCESPPMKLKLNFKGFTVPSFEQMTTICVNTSRPSPVFSPLLMVADY